MHKKIASTFMVLGCLVLTACGNAGSQDSSSSPESEAISSPTFSVPDRQGYSNIHAVFNQERQTVETPLDKYAHSEDEHIVIATANYLLLKQCATKKGSELPHHFYQTEYRSDIPFGVWSTAFAEKYGYQINHSLGRIYVDEGYQGEDNQEIQKTFESCIQEVEGQEIPVLIKGFSLAASAETSVLSEVSGQVDYFLVEDPDVKAAVEEWKNCLAQQGIAMNPEYENPIPVIPEEKEQNIKQALIDVQCKKEVSLMERYYDAQAQYEQALIEKNQAAFNTLAERKEEYFQQAKEILVQNGIKP